MPNRDKTGPTGKGPNTGRGAGECKDIKDTTEKQLETQRGTGRGPCGNGKPRGGGGNGRGRRRGSNGITYFT